jgi:hypothetical protein
MWALRTVNVLFEYIPNDFDGSVQRCELWLNASGAEMSLNKTSTAINNGNLNSFSLNNVPVGLYKWNVRCFDDLDSSSFADADETFEVAAL